MITNNLSNRIIICFLCFSSAAAKAAIHRSPPGCRHRSLQSSSSFSNSVAKLTASNGGLNNVTGGDNFGGENALAISNNRIIVGAIGYDQGRGAAYLFSDPNDQESGRSYSEIAILMASGVGFFGDSVAIDGDIIVVGTNEVYTNGPGSAYVYRIIDNNNTIAISQVAKLTAFNGRVEDQFGSPVAIQGNYILVGARGENLNHTFAAGSAYLFGNPSNDLNTPEWTQFMQFQPNDLTELDSFGYSVAMDENIAAIGTESNDASAHAVYVFAPVNYDKTVNPSSTFCRPLGLKWQNLPDQQITFLDRR
jgi:hypothetical protein